MCESGRTNCETKELMETSKAIIVVYDPKYCPCLLLGKEKCNGKYWLFWGQIEKWESPEETLSRELGEEMFWISKDKKQQKKKSKKKWKSRERSWHNDQVYVHQKEKIYTFKTKSHNVNLYAVSLWNRYLQLSKEHSWIQIYPLDKKYENERKAIESNMEPYVKEAVKQFRKKYTDYRQWKNLQSWIRWREDVRLSQQAQREMKHFQYTNSPSKIKKK